MTTGWEKGWKKSVSRLLLYTYERNPTFSYIPKVAALYDTPRTLAMNLVTRATTIDPRIFVTFCTVVYMNMGGISWMYCLNTWKPALIKNPSSASTEYICVYYIHHIIFFCRLFIARCHQNTGGDATYFHFSHDDVIKWKHFLRYWPFVWGIHRSRGNSPHKGLWRRALIFSLICAWTNGCANSRDAGDLRRHCAHYEVTVMGSYLCFPVISLHAMKNRRARCKSGFGKR